MKIKRLSKWSNGWWIRVICKLSAIRGCVMKLVLNNSNGKLQPHVAGTHAWSWAWQIVFLGIENIYATRDSLGRLREYLDLLGAASSDGTSSLLISYWNILFGMQQDAPFLYK